MKPLRLADSTFLRRTHRLKHLSVLVLSQVEHNIVIRFGIVLSVCLFSRFVIFSFTHQTPPIKGNRLFQVFLHQNPNYVVEESEIEHLAEVQFTLELLSIMVEALQFCIERKIANREISKDIYERAYKALELKAAQSKE